MRPYPAQMKLLFKLMSTKELVRFSDVSCVCQFDLHLFLMPDGHYGISMIPSQVYNETVH